MDPSSPLLKYLPAGAAAVCAVSCAEDAQLVCVERLGAPEGALLLVTRQGDRLFLSMVVPVRPQLAFTIDGSGAAPIVEVDDYMVRAVGWEGLDRLQEVVTTLIARAAAANADATAWAEQLFPAQSYLGDFALPPYSRVVSKRFFARGAPSSGPVSMRRLYIHTQLRLREAEFTDVRPLHIFFGTWNVCGRPPAGQLTAWLLVEGMVADVVVCGLQEADQSTSTIVFNSESTKADPWIAAIATTLARVDTYVLRVKQQLGGVLQLVWVRKAVLDVVSDLQEDSKSTGFGGIMANKGGVGARLDIFDSSFCFVCSHLNAHDENVERRNQDFAAIAAEMRFSDERSVWDHQFLFWYGDLNYRIALPRSRIFDLLAASNYAELLANDQLNAQRQLGTAFSEFAEGPVNWPPTYRFDVGTHTYDTSEKRRRPSYTDRVLHWAASPAALEQLHYHSVGELTLSDHKPVYAVYRVQARQRRPKDYARVCAAVMRELDSLETTLQPMVELSTTELAFGEVRYGALAERLVTVRNTGKVLVAWRFVVPPLAAPTGASASIGPTATLAAGGGAAGATGASAPALSSPLSAATAPPAPMLPPSSSGPPKERGVCKQWARVEPLAAELMPGESCTVKVFVLVEGSGVANDLDMGREQLEDVLVLRVLEGSDHFITVQGRYQVCSCALVIHCGAGRLPRSRAPSQRSCFGCALDQLVRLPQPIRSATNMLKPEEALRVPKELWTLVDHLYRHGLNEEGLFLVHGVEAEKCAIRECLDTGAPLEPAWSAHSVAETLLLFLDALPHPVIPIAFYAQCIDPSASHSFCKQVVESLPEVNYNVFHYLVSFGREMLTPNKYRHRVMPRELARELGNVLLRPPSESRYRKASAVEKHEAARTEFIQRFLEASDE